MTHQRNLKFWQVDAFSDQPFKGNPAAVFVLEEDISDSLKRQIANEMNLSETAFVLLRQGENPFIQWITPNGKEMDMCGHATLASSHILFSEIFPDKEEIIFSTKSAGDLPITRTAHGYQMDFPTAKLEETTDNLDLMRQLIGVEPLYMAKTSMPNRFMVIIEDEQSVKDINLNHPVLQEIPQDGLLVAALSDNSNYDYGYRFFGHKIGIVEDPTNGSGHTLMAPYFTKILGQESFKAKSLSAREGDVFVKLDGARTKISGTAHTVFKSVIEV